MDEMDKAPGFLGLYIGVTRSSRQVTVIQIHVVCEKDWEGWWGGRAFVHGVTCGLKDEEGSEAVRGSGRSDGRQS